VLHLLLLFRRITTDSNCRDRNDPVYRAALVEECGDLGVLDVPEGQLESEVRHCAEHPRNGDSPAAFDRRNRRGSISIADSAATDIFGRAEQKCWYGASLGCRKGYCWKTCGKRGNWCWLTAFGPSGPWLECSRTSDCDSTVAVCSGGNCKACGCGGCP
jgi:hypothetical protein